MQNLLAKKKTVWVQDENVTQHQRASDFEFGFFNQVLPKENVKRHVSCT